jgi:hypothetical protein
VEGVYSKQDVNHPTYTNYYKKKTENLSYGKKQVMFLKLNNCRPAQTHTEPRKALNTSIKAPPKGPRRKSLT